MIHVGITGCNGFIGYHLKNTLEYTFNGEFKVIPFLRGYFENDKELDLFVSKCDVIVHLAAVNRHAELNQLSKINISLSEKLLASLKRVNRKIHVIITSSIQEYNDNLYGSSKKISRELLANWAKEYKQDFTGLILPNIYGPFCKPYYNSVVATFCEQIIQGEKPNIIEDREIELLYISNLVDKIIETIKKKICNEKVHLKCDIKIKVSDLLKILNTFNHTYLLNNTIPDLSDSFQLNLFNTFRSYLKINKTFPISYKVHSDSRGNFVEVIRTDNKGQTSFSTTKPGITRGNHFHTRKVERFTIIQGKAQISLRKIGTEEVINLNINGNKPSFVDIPIWYTHNLTNTGKEDLIMNFWINESYNVNDPDTYFINV